MSLQQNVINPDKIEGMLLGVALGDALGVPFEFRFSLPLSEYDGTLKYKGKINSQWQGVRYMVVGQVSDDTEMTLALANSLIQNNEHPDYNREKVILAYESWANSGNIGMGTNTRSLLKGVTTIKGFENRYKRGMNGTLKGMKYDNLTLVQSNGSLMRCTPLALIPEKDDFLKALKEDVYLTNPNNVNYECGLVYLTAIRHLLKFDTKGLIAEGIDTLHNTLKELWTHLSSLPKEESILKVFNSIMTNEEVDVSGRDKGWVVHGFYCAMWSLHRLIQDPTLLYQDLVNDVILKGGDTDTNGAIAGGLIGSYWGYEMMTDPENEDRTAFNKEVLLNADPDSGDFPRQYIYHPNTINKLSNVYM